MSWLLSVLFAGMFALILPGASAHAQSQQTIPAQNVVPDRNGVDITSGGFTTASPFSFNAPGAGHLNFRTVYNGHRLTFPLSIYMDDETFSEEWNPPFRQLKLNVDGAGRFYSCGTTGKCSADSVNDGAVLTRLAEFNYEYVDRLGVKYEFYEPLRYPLEYCQTSNMGCNNAVYSAYYFVSKITYPSGEKLTFSPFAERESVDGKNFIYDVITSNLGYDLRYYHEFPLDLPISTIPGGNWSGARHGYNGESRFELYHGSVRIGRITSNISNTYNSKLKRVTDIDLLQRDELNREYKAYLHADGVVWCTGDLGGTCTYPVAADYTYFVPRKVVLPSQKTYTMTYASYPIGGTLPVKSVFDGSDTWLYNYTRDAYYGISHEITDPLGGKYKYHVVGGGNPYQTSYENPPDPPILDRKLVGYQDPLGRKFKYGYLYALQKPVVTGYPENDERLYDLDDRANITAVRLKGKDGTLLNAEGIWSASYDETCQNQVTCNLPRWIRDGNLNKTEYEYDSAHGGVTSETLPADVIGKRATIKYGYTPLDTGAGTIYRLTRIARCMTQAACENTADEVVTTRTYWGATFLVESETVQAGGV
jgi:hypothetical protein